MPRRIRTNSTGRRSVPRSVVPVKALKMRLQAMAAIDQDRCPVATMDLEAVAVAVVGAGQAVRMEQADEELVAGGLVHQLGDREVHGRPLIGAEGPFPLISTE